MRSGYIHPPSSHPLFLHSKLPPPFPILLPSPFPSFFPPFPSSNIYWTSMTRQILHQAPSDPCLLTLPTHFGKSCCSACPPWRLHSDVTHSQKPALTSTPSLPSQSPALPEPLSVPVWHLSLSTLDYSYLCTRLISLPD